MTPKQIHVICASVDEAGARAIKEFGLSHEVTSLTPANYQTVLKDLKQGDFVLNLSVDVSSCDLIKFAKSRGSLYLDTCVEPWAGGYASSGTSITGRTNYALREQALSLREPGAPTAVITHGANPGFVSHFAKQVCITLIHCPYSLHLVLRVFDL
jgi:homospermidine synthase